MTDGRKRSLVPGTNRNPLFAKQFGSPHGLANTGVGTGRQRTGRSWGPISWGCAAFSRPAAIPHPGLSPGTHVPRDNSWASRATPSVTTACCIARYPLVVGYRSIRTGGSQCGAEWSPRPASSPSLFVRQRNHWRGSRLIGCSPSPCKQTAVPSVLRTPGDCHSHSAPRRCVQTFARWF